MATIGYPQSCTSMFCGKICCDGCAIRPTLAAYHERRGELAEYEARQTQARALTAKWAAEEARP